MGFAVASIEDLEMAEAIVKQVKFTDAQRAAIEGYKKMGYKNMVLVLRGEQPSSAAPQGLVEEFKAILTTVKFKQSQVTAISEMGRKVGYGNIMKMVGGKTAKQLKGLE